MRKLREVLRLGSNSNWAISRSGEAAKPTYSMLQYGPVRFSLPICLAGSFLQASRRYKKSHARRRDANIHTGLTGRTPETERKFWLLEYDSNLRPFG